MGGRILEKQSVNWIQFAEVRVEWRVFMNTVRNLLVSYKMQEFHDQLNNLSAFQGRAHYHSI
jgi:hypothetical protein